MEYFFNFEKATYVKAPRPQECILCLQQSGSQKVADLRVFETDTHVVSVNLYPYNPGHLLVYPRRHVLDLRGFSLREEENQNKIVRYMLDILDKTHKPQGFNIGYNMGPVAGASIEHLHLHIIPRYRNETGIADLIAKKRVLIEDPFQTKANLQKIIADYPFSSFCT